MARVVRHKHWPEDHPYYEAAQWHYATKKACDEQYREWQLARKAAIEARIALSKTVEAERRDAAYREHIKHVQLEVPVGHEHPEVKR